MKQSESKLLNATVLNNPNTVSKFCSKNKVETQKTKSTGKFAEINLYFRS